MTRELPGQITETFRPGKFRFSETFRDSSVLVGQRQETVGAAQDKVLPDSTAAVDRDRSEWTSTRPANLRTDCKSSQVMYAGLQKALPSSKIGVPGVLARILGLLLEDPEVCPLGFCVAFVSQKDIMHTQSAEFAELSLS